MTHLSGNDRGEKSPLRDLTHTQLPPILKGMACVQRAQRREPRTRGPRLALLSVLWLGLSGLGLGGFGIGAAGCGSIGSSETGAGGTTVGSDRSASGLLSAEQVFATQKTGVAEARAPEPYVWPEPTEVPGVLGLKTALYDPSGRAMGKLHEALSRAARGEGQARLLFYGASHVASDMFTGHIRQELQTRFGDAGPGFAMPVKPWRWYRRQGLEIKSDWRKWDALRIRVTSRDTDQFGLAGVAVEADHAGGFGVIETKGMRGVSEAASLFDLYYMQRPGGGDLDILVDGAPAKRVSTNADMVGPGYARVEVGDGAHRFEVRLKGNGPVRLFGAVLERDQPGVVVDTLGINGARARYQLLWDEHVQKEHVARREPDLVALAYGTNESGDDDVPIANYEESLREVLTRMKAVAGEASCLLIGPSDRPIRDRRTGELSDRERQYQLNDVQRRVSAEFGCAYFDVIAFMGGPESMTRWVHNDPPYGAADHVHFTWQGYSRLGEVLLDAMMDGYRDWRSVKPAAVPHDHAKQ